MAHEQAVFKSRGSRKTCQVLVFGSILDAQQKVKMISEQAVYIDHGYGANVPGKELQKVAIVALLAKNTSRLLPRLDVTILTVLQRYVLGHGDPPSDLTGFLKPVRSAIVDATEQRVRRSSDHQTQQEHYSGKKKCHTRKTQIIVSEKGIIRDASTSTPGKTHDLELFRQSGAARRIPKNVGVGGDAGYQGLHHELPDHSVATAHKARRNHPLTEDEKSMNREFSSMRIIVENTICELKHFKVLSERFHHDVDGYDDVFRAVIALVNPRIARRVAAVAA